MGAIPAGKPGSEEAGGGVRVQMFFNPASGRASPRLVDRLEAAFARLGADVVLVATGSVPPVIAAGADHVVVVGGDGTVRHVAHALLATDRAPALSVYPGGTINLLAREWRGRPSADAFARRVLTRDDRSRLAVEWEGGTFLCCAGAGWESDVVAAVDERWKRRIGRFAYLMAALRLLARWKPPRIELVADGRTIRCEGFHVAKGVHYAGRWRLTGRAMAGEPTMQVIALRRARRRDLARFWWALVRGRHGAALPGVEVIECRTLAATADRPLPVQADGDLIGSLPLAFQVGDRPIATC